MLVLVTRPRAQAGATVRALAAMGHEALVEPALEIVPLPFPEPAEPVAAVVLTSANAAAAVPGRLRGVPVFAVGAATAEAATRAGCGDVRAGTDDGCALAGLVRASLEPRDGVVLHLAAEEVREGLEEGLAGAGFAYRRVAAYRAVPSAGLSATARSALTAGRVGAALFLSPRSAAVFAGHARSAGLEGRLGATVAACLSEAVAAEIRDLPWRAVRIAAARDHTALLAVLADPTVEC